jgi:hypothetical protein
LHIVKALNNLSDCVLFFVSILEALTNKVQNQEYETANESPNVDTRVVVAFGPLHVVLHFLIIDLYFVGG